MKKIINSVVLLVFILNITGCATILKEKETQVKVDSEPQGAEVYLTTHRRETRLGRTPTTLTLDNRRSADLTFKKDGYEDSSHTIKSDLAGGWMLASFICGIMPAFIDLVSKNGKEFKETEVKVTLDPVLPKQTEQTKK